MSGESRAFSPDQQGPNTPAAPTQVVAATTTSVAVPLNKYSPVMLIDTDQVVYVRFGDASVVATAFDTKVRPGAQVLSKGGAEYVAIIADTAATVRVTTGEGSLMAVLPGGAGGTGGGGDASAANQLAPLGTVAPGAVAAKSVLGGLQYNQNLVTIPNTQGAALQGDQAGNLKMRLHGTAAAGADGLGNAFAHISGHNQSTGNSALLPVVGMLYNGATYDRQRGNTKGTFVVPPALTGTSRSKTVGTTVIQMAPANASRSGLIMQNLDATKTFYWAVGADPVPGGLDTFEIGPKGSVFLQSGYVDAGEIRGIASAAGCNVSAREY